MKKWIALALCLVMVLGLCACKENPQAGPQAWEKAPEGKVLVGFGKVCINPDQGAQVSLVGYGGNGTPPTPMTGKLNDVYGTCVAITDTKGETVLIYTVDTLYTTKDEVDSIRAAVTAKTGIAGDRVVVSGTHTHSSVRYTDITDYANKMAQAAADALADRVPATVQTGSAPIENMSFIRHYKTQNGIIVGDNFSGAISSGNPIVEHATQADTQMQMIRYVREGDKQDVLMVNWQVHPKVASSGDNDVGLAQRSMLSADFIGFARDYIQQETGCLVAYYTGAAGNLNPRSRIPAEQKLCSIHVKEYGEAFAKQVVTAMGGLKDTAAGDVICEQKMLPVTPIDGAEEMEITAIRVGNVGFATVPFEMFDTNGKEIKDGSGLETTFVLTCASMPQHSYIPSSYVWDYDTGTQVAYELGSSKHVKGTAEQVAAALAEMLKN